MCQDPNKQARQNARAKNAALLRGYRNKANLFHSNEQLKEKGNQEGIVSFTATRGDGQERAYEIAGKAREASVASTVAYAQQQRVDEGGGARNAGRNQFLAMLSKNAQIQNQVTEAWGVGIQKHENKAFRELKGYQRKLDEKYPGWKPTPPQLVPVPGKDKFGTLMDGINKAKTVGALAAAPFTGGASLSLIGVGQWGAKDGKALNTIFGGKVTS